MHARVRAHRRLNAAGSHRAKKRANYTMKDELTGTSLYIFADLKDTFAAIDLCTPRSLASSQRSNTRKDALLKIEKSAVICMAIESLRLSMATAKLPSGEAKGRPKT